VHRSRLTWHRVSSRQQGRSETEEYSSDSESESEDEEELQLILEDLQKQNEELEVCVERDALRTISRTVIAAVCSRLAQVGAPGGVTYHTGATAAVTPCFCVLAVRF